MKVALCLFSLFLTLDSLAQNTELTKILNSKDSIWRAGHLNLPYWDSTFSHHSVRGYIDTFSVLNSRFRIIHNENLFDGTVETYKSKQWITNFQFESLAGHEGYDRTKDVNFDGYIDLIWTTRWDTQVFLFNPKLKKFTDTSFFHPREWTLIDIKEKIFCDSWEHWYFTENHSKLYTFEGNKLVELYHLEFLSSDSKGELEDRSKLVEKVVLCKVINDKKAIKIKEIIVDSDVFNYLDFWKSHYKELLKL
jgi:hypothetical protein